MKARFFGACAVLLLGVVATAQEGEPAPPFAVKTDRGHRLTATAFGGKVLVLNFWQTECAPCVKELPSLTALAGRFRSQGLVVLAISADEDVTEYRSFLRRHRVRLETYREPSMQISRSYGTSQFPETYIIQDGRIVRKVVGGIDWTGDQVVAFLHGLLPALDAAGESRQYGRHE